MFKHRMLVPFAMLALAAVLTACGQQTLSSTPAPSSGVGVVPPASPGASQSPVIEPSAAPTPSVAPRPTPTPRERLARWSTKPARIFAAECNVAVATVDASGRFHVAAECDQHIRYASSTNGRAWTASTIPTPKERFDVDPQLAIDGTTLYLAFTRLRPIDGGCGDDGLTAVGVFYRTRTLPDGDWSQPTQFGLNGDELEAFRVVGGVMHETVVAEDGKGPVVYAVAHGSTMERLTLPNANGTSLRVGDDGRARIAYTTAHAVKYAVVGNDGKATTSTVFAASDVFMAGPVLVLGSSDRAYVSWAALPVDAGGGCAEPEPPKPPHVGTWFATDVSGSWSTKRLSRDIGSAQLVVDVDSGRVHATYHDRRGIRYVTRAADGTWSGSRLDASIDLWSTTLRRNPTNGQLLLVGVNASDALKPGVYALTAS